MELPSRIVSIACHQFIPCSMNPPGERVGGDDDAHADPERGDVVGRPRSLFYGRRREVPVPQRRVRHVFVQLDEVSSARVQFEQP